MEHVLSLVGSYGSRRYEEDFVDRLNFQYTSHLFAFAALVGMYKVYFGGNPITCWVPAEFTKGWTEYARDYCLIENTYFVPIEDPDMPEGTIREEQELPYYQWVQFILVFQAFLFYAPHLFWRSVNWWSGLQVRAVITSAAGIEKDKPLPLEKVLATRNDSITKVAKHIALFESRRRKSWVSLMYLATKILFILNIIFQIMLLHLFLGFSWNDFFRLRIGFNSDWASTGIFPRQTMCDFDIRTKGNVQKYSVQCVLAMNMVNEKIFLLLFYWLLALLVATVVNTFLWMQSMYSSRERREFASRMLKAAGEHGDTFLQTPALVINDEKTPLYETHSPVDDRLAYQRFLSLNPELATILNLIAANAGDNVCSDVTAAIYRLHKQKSE
ncbi:unnamed protein product [Caenorhabditis auriculariae]|uniref:Innexin n=1 Tax=Caenorhabditis auriculariae TaxID=2777116 RepID=A0A8S1HE39_9PELO|nr:unnamed protein product [Caenorhabditis auriculariae]